LRHLEQADQHAEFVPPRYPSEVGDGMSYEGSGLIRPTIPRWIIISRPPIPTRRWGLPPLP
jgi:hypothetical protein